MKILFPKQVLLGYIFFCLLNDPVQNMSAALSLSKTNTCKKKKRKEKSSSGGDTNV